MHTTQPPDIPPFHDWGQSIAAAWDVWLATHEPAAQLDRVARRRLMQIVGLARERSAFYRERYRALDQYDWRLADLPVVTKPELMAHFDEAVLDADATRGHVEEFVADAGRVGRPLLGRYAVWTSSGTTGEPGVFLHDGHALAVYEALQLVRFRHFGSPALFAAAFLSDDRYALVGATGGHFAGNASIERLRLLYPWCAERLRIFSILEALPALVRRLNDYQPTLLATYPTAGSLLADEQLAGRLVIQPREIWTGGEQLSNAARAHIAAAFSCGVRDDYGASEFLAIGWDCGYGALHLNADWVLLEPVDERYRPMPPGVPSHSALLTNLANRVQPLIRYDIGDSVTLLDGACECGSPFPAIRVDGRSDDALALADSTGRMVRLLPLALTTVLEDEAGVYRFQLLQTGAARLTLRIDPNACDEVTEERCRHAIGQFLHTQGLSNVDLAIHREPLQRHARSGKLRRIVARA